MLVCINFLNKSASVSRKNVLKFSRSVVLVLGGLTKKIHFWQGVQEHFSAILRETFDFMRLLNSIFTQIFSGFRLLEHSCFVCFCSDLFWRNSKTSLTQPLDGKYVELLLN